MRPLPTLCLALVILAAGCGGAKSADALLSDASAALGKSDHAGALEGFEQALAQLEPSDPLYPRAALGAVEAEIAVDGAKAKERFLALAAAHPGAVAEKDYRAIGSKMANSLKYEEAIYVVDAAIKRFGKNEGLETLMDALIRDSKSDPGAQSALAGLGYLGGK